MAFKVGIISQARMTSTRLPGKVLKTVQGKSLLEYHLSRLQKSGFPICLATTINKTDDPLVYFAEQQGLAYFRGDEQDVLSRYHGAALKMKWDLIVRVTSDCPLIDGELINDAVKIYQQDGRSPLYISNCLTRTYPRGFDFEVFSFAMLDEAFKKATSSSDREHVTPYIHQNRNGRTHLLNLPRETDLHQFRLTVDEPDDFKLIERLISQYHCDQLSEKEIGEVLKQHPELGLINQHVEQKKL